MAEPLLRFGLNSIIFTQNFVNNVFSYFYFCLINFFMSVKNITCCIDNSWEDLTSDFSLWKGV